jgi:two-component system, NtrC family, response regulator AlgB
MARLLIVNDEKNIRTNLATFLESCGHQVSLAGDVQEALGALAAVGTFDLTLTDYRMAEMNGLELLQEIRRRDPGALVVLMTAYATVQNAVAAMKGGAYDYLTKPFSLDQIQHVVERALEVRHLRSENQALRGTLEELPLLDSRSPVMCRLLETAERVAASEATIMLIGESGSGKNVLAGQIHRWSARRDKPFVVVNCTTLSEDLLESELFGHLKGSFTGAIKDKPGRLEAADGGTVFLDEIADLSGPLQAKFLRFVEEQAFERVGGQQTIHVDTRLIVASNRDLEAEVAAHHFRDDLFYRLNVIALRVPALRDRGADIMPLAERMLTVAAARDHRRPLTFSGAAVATLTHYHWPGNVRELRNAVERAVILAPGDEITPELLPDALFRQARDTAATNATPASLDELEREHIARVLAESPTLEDAAETLGINVSTLWRKRKRYQID